MNSTRDNTTSDAMKVPIMSATGHDVFDKTLQSTNRWLDEIMPELRPHRHVAWHAFTVVLHAVRDRLRVELLFTSADSCV